MSICEPTRRMTCHEKEAYDLIYKQGKEDAVVHGEWINTVNDKSKYGLISGKCSNCGLHSGLWYVNRPYEYCPYCGACMDGDLNKSNL
jgi:hypothetical protein